MTEDFDVVVGLKRVESRDDFRFATREGTDSTLSERRILDLDGEGVSIPIPADMLAYDPQSKTYLGMTREGITWRSFEKDSAENGQDSGTIGKAPIDGTVTFLDFFHGRFWCVGTDFQILSSVNGSNWEVQLDRKGVDATHHPGVWTSISGGENEEIYAVGLDGIIGIFDGSEWNLDRVDGIGFWDSITIGGITYACGSKGKIARRLEEEWEVISTQESDSFISFARVANKVYISTETKLFEFQIRGIDVHLNRVGAGGKLLSCDSTLFVLKESGKLSALARGN